MASAVEALRGALGAARSFDPAAARGILRIAALDAEQAGLIPPLAAALRASAPGLTLSVLPLGRQAAVEALTEGRADLALGLIPDPPEAIRQEVLYQDSYLVAGRPLSLPDAPQVALATFCAADHVLVSPGGDLRGVVDDQLGRLGLSRRVVLGLPAFLPALAAVSASGALVTLPARIARAFAPGFGLVTAEPPLPLRPFAISCHWHRRNDADPRLAWVRGRIAEVARLP